VKFADRPVCIPRDRGHDLSTVLDDLVKALPQDEDRLWRERLFRGYFDDMYGALTDQYRLLRPGGWSFCVVGNSLHGSAEKVLVASDLIIASIAELVGFTVKGIDVARHLKRRTDDSRRLRESVIVLQKPLKGSA
jgi:hypothetical protein